MNQPEWFTGRAKPATASRLEDRTPEQAARLAELLAAGWTIEEELRLLAVVILTRRTSDGGTEYKTIAPRGQSLTDSREGP